MNRKMVDYSSRDSRYRSDEHPKDGYSLDIKDTLRILNEEIRSCKEDNDRIIQSKEKISKAQERQAKVNVIILESLSDLQREGQQQISYGNEEKTNEAYGTMSHGGNESDRDDMVIDDRSLDTLDRRGNGYELYSSFGLDRYHGHHRYHPYKRSDKGYLLNEFKKAKPPTFDGELNKLRDGEAWLLG